MTNSLKQLSLIVLIVIFFCSCGVKRGQKSPRLTIHKTGNVNFYEGDFGLLLDKAEVKKRPIFVDVYADWCLPCKQMDKFVFTDNNLAEFLNDNFISYKLDSEGSHGQLLKTVYSIGVLPSILIFSRL